MNRVNKAKLATLVQKCEAALRDKHQQSFNVFRGEMWAIVSAAHELRKRGVLESAQSADAVDPHASSTGKPTTRV